MNTVEIKRSEFDALHILKSICMDEDSCRLKKAKFLSSEHGWLLVEYVTIPGNGKMGVMLKQIIIK